MNINSEKLFTIILFLFVISCSRDKPADVGSQKLSDPRAGDIYSLRIMPVNATRKTTLYLILKGVTPSDAKIEWLVNGSPIKTSTGDQFNAALAQKKDKIQARAIIKGREILSNMIEIGNSSPEISNIKILPEDFNLGDNLYVAVSVVDFDEDQVTVSYEWTKNGEPAGESWQIEGKLKQGDKISVKITPYDGEVYGRSVVLHREIGDLLPIVP